MIRKTVGLVILACASMVFGDPPPDPGTGENEVKSPIKITSTSYDMFSIFSETLTVDVSTHRRATGDPGNRRIWVSLYAEMRKEGRPILHHLYQKIENWDSPYGDDNETVVFDISPDVFGPFSIPGYEMTGQVRVVIETAWWNPATSTWDMTDSREEYIWYYW